MPSPISRSACTSSYSPDRWGRSTADNFVLLPASTKRDKSSTFSPAVCATGLLAQQSHSHILCPVQTTFRTSCPILVGYNLNLMVYSSLNNVLKDQVVLPRRLSFCTGSLEGNKGIAPPLTFSARSQHDPTSSDPKPELVYFGSPNRAMCEDIPTWNTQNSWATETGSSYRSIPDRPYPDNLALRQPPLRTELQHHQDHHQRYRDIFHYQRSRPFASFAWSGPTGPGTRFREPTAAEQRRAAAEAAWRAQQLRWYAAKPAIRISVRPGEEGWEEGMAQHGGDRRGDSEGAEHDPWWRREFGPRRLQSAVLVPCAQLTVGIAARVQERLHALLEPATRQGKERARRFARAGEPVVKLATRVLFIAGLVCVFFLLAWAIYERYIYEDPTAIGSVKYFLVPEFRVWSVAPCKCHK
jgi:hypothetical protein